MIRSDKIEWKTHNGISGDVQGMLIASYRGLSLSELYFKSSNRSYSRARQKIINRYHEIFW